MKAILCAKCGDLVPLAYADRGCGCGGAHGRYLDGERAVYSGSAVPLGISGPDIAEAIRRWPREGAEIRMWVDAAGVRWRREGA